MVSVVIRADNLVGLVAEAVQHLFMFPCTVLFVQVLGCCPTVAVFHS